MMINKIYWNNLYKNKLMIIKKYKIIYQMMNGKNYLNMNRIKWKKEKNFLILNLIRNFWYIKFLNI